MLPQETLKELQKYSSNLLTTKEPSGRKRLRYIGLAHLKDGKSMPEVAATLRVTRHAVMPWVTLFSHEDLSRLAGMPPTCSTQPLRAQEAAFWQAVEQLQHSRGSGCLRGGHMYPCVLRCNEKIVHCVKVRLTAYSGNELTGAN